MQGARVGGGGSCEGSHCRSGHALLLAPLVGCAWPPGNCTQYPDPPSPSYALQARPASLRALLDSTLPSLPDEVLDAPARQLGPRAAAGFDWRGNRVAASPQEAAPAAADAAAGAADAAGVGASQPAGAHGGRPAYALGGDFPVTGQERAGIQQTPETEGVSAKQEMNEAKKRYKQSLPGLAGGGKGSSGGGGGTPRAAALEQQQQQQQLAAAVVKSVAG